MLLWVGLFSRTEIDEGVRKPVNILLTKYMSGKNGTTIIIMLIVFNVRLSL